MTNRLPIIILAGPTASGKSAVALDIVQAIGAVIINCDAMQVYQQIPIITAQPSKAEQILVQHALYGCVSVAEQTSVSYWLSLVKPVIKQVWEQGKVPLIVGGTGMYIKGLLEGIAPIPEVDLVVRQEVRDEFARIGNEAFYAFLAKEDPQTAARLRPSDSQRIVRAMEVWRQTGQSLVKWQETKPGPLYPQAEHHVFFLCPDREKAYANCDLRFKTMLTLGVVDEIRALEKLKLRKTLPAMKAHGVPELLAYLQGEISLDAAMEQAILNTRHYIKRQFTWYRGQMPDAMILDGNNLQEAGKRLVDKFVDKSGGKVVFS